MSVAAVSQWETWHLTFQRSTEQPWKSIRFFLTVSRLGGVCVVGGWGRECVSACLCVCVWEWRGKGGGCWGKRRPNHPLPPITFNELTLLSAWLRKWTVRSRPLTSWPTPRLSSGQVRFAGCLIYRPSLPSHQTQLHPHSQSTGSCDWDKPWGGQTVSRDAMQLSPASKCCFTSNTR